MNPLQTVQFVQHGSVCVVLNGVTVYVDPCDLHDDPHDADVVIITHAQASRYSPADIDKVRQDDTCFIVPAPVYAALENAFGIEDCYLIRVDGETPTVYLECGVGVTPVPVYCKELPVKDRFGALVHLDGCTYYFSGGTDLNMLADVKCNVLFLLCDAICDVPHWEDTLRQAIAELDVLPALAIAYESGSRSDDMSARFAAQVRTVLEAAGVLCASF